MSEHTRTMILEAIGVAVGVAWLFLLMGALDILKGIAP